MLRRFLGASQSAPFGPLISVVVVIHIAQHQTILGPMHDDSDVSTDANGPEIPVLCSVQFVEFKPRTGRVGLQVEGSRFYRLLLFIGQFGQAVGEGVGDEEVHWSEITVWSAGSSFSANRLSLGSHWSSGLAGFS